MGARRTPFPQRKGHHAPDHTGLTKKRSLKPGGHCCLCLLGPPPAPPAPFTLPRGPVQVGVADDCARVSVVCCVNQSLMGSSPLPPPHPATRIGLLPLPGSGLAPPSPLPPPLTLGRYLKSFYFPLGFSFIFVVRPLVDRSGTQPVRFPVPPHSP